MTFNCTKIRTMFRTSYQMDITTGERTNEHSEWVTEPCGAPLFGDAQRASGLCRPCATGWKHPNNYPADEERPEVES